MQCKLYENVCCIITPLSDKVPSNYECNECLIHNIVEHDKRIDKDLSTFFIPNSNKNKQGE